MSGKAEKLQEAIGLIKDEYVEEAHGEDAANRAEDQATTQETTQTTAKTVGTTEGTAKMVRMPAQRKRRHTAVPIAIAACLVIALGVGALAFLNMPTDKYASEKKEEVAVEKTDGESTTLMMTESATDGAMETEGAGSVARDSGTTSLVPGIPAPGNIEGEAFVLTAGEWNDNDNWAFFTNLVNSGTISFPVFGLDPTNRVKATVVDASGNPIRGEEVTLLDASGAEIWRGVSDKDGNAYLFYHGGQTPGSVSAGGVTEPLAVAVPDSDNQQGEPTMRPVDDVTIEIGSAPAKAAGLQVMFIVDTTGSMSDEIAYLQKDFAAIAADAGSDGIEYSVNFYRDEGDDYVTKCNGFTSDISEVQALLNKEYADGGGDTPEAVADILAETITDNGNWRSDYNKVAFLIFDAPPHDGTDTMLDEAVRSAAANGIHLVPVVASNADRETELFGRALSIMTDAPYVFLTDDSGVGNSHLEPIIGDYTVEKLHDVIVRIINDYR